MTFFQSSLENSYYGWTGCTFIDLGAVSSDPLSLLNGEVSIYESDFSSDENGWTVTSGDETSGISHNVDKLNIAVTSIGTQSLRPRLSKTLGTINEWEEFRVEIDYIVNSGTCILNRVNIGSTTDFLYETLSGSGTLYFHIVADGTLNNLRLFFDGKNLFDIDLAEVRVFQTKRNSIETGGLILQTADSAILSFDILSNLFLNVSDSVKFYLLPSHFHTNLDDWRRIYRIGTDSIKLVFSEDATQRELIASDSFPLTISELGSLEAFIYGEDTFNLSLEYDLVAGLQLQSEDTLTIMLNDAASLTARAEDNMEITFDTLTLNYHSSSDNLKVRLRDSSIKRRKGTDEFLLLSFLETSNFVVSTIGSIKPKLMESSIIYVKTSENLIIGSVIEEKEQVHSIENSDSILLSFSERGGMVLTSSDSLLISISDSIVFGKQAYDNLIIEMEEEVQEIITHSTPSHVIPTRISSAFRIGGR